LQEQSIWTKDFIPGKTWPGATPKNKRDFIAAWEEKDGDGNPNGAAKWVFEAACCADQAAMMKAQFFEGICPDKNKQVFLEKMVNPNLDARKNERTLSQENQPSKNVGNLVEDFAWEVDISDNYMTRSLRDEDPMASSEGKGYGYLWFEHFHDQKAAHYHALQEPTMLLGEMKFGWKIVQPGKSVDQSLTQRDQDVEYVGASGPEKFQQELETKHYRQLTCGTTCNALPPSESSVYADVKRGPEECCRYAVLAQNPRNLAPGFEVNRLYKSLKAPSTATGISASHRGRSAALELDRPRQTGRM
jgi:hypothetical protein